jgi:hypothetical protein
MSVFLQPLQTVTVGAGGASSITFSSIPQTFTDLIFEGSIRTDRGTYGVDETLVQFNGDSTATNYSHTFIRGQGTSGADSGRVTNSYIWGVGGTASTNTANTFGNSQMYIANYTGSNYKTAITDIVSEGNSSSNVFMVLDAGLWRNTSAITSVAFNNQGTIFLQYSKISLYGVLRQGI